MKKMTFILLISLSILSSSCSSPRTTYSDSNSSTGSVTSPTPQLSQSTTTKSTTKTTTAVFDAPHILVKYDEIINTYHLRTNSSTQFSEKEVEEIFNLLKTIQYDPKFLEYPVQTYYHIQRTFSLYGIFLDGNGDHFTISFSDSPGIQTTNGTTMPQTSGSGTIYSFKHRSDGKYELTGISIFIR